MGPAASSEAPSRPLARNLSSHDHTPVKVLRERGNWDHSKSAAPSRPGTYPVWPPVGLLRVSSGGRNMSGLHRCISPGDNFLFFFFCFTSVPNAKLRGKCNCAGAGLALLHALVTANKTFQRMWRRVSQECLQPPSKPLCYHAVEMQRFSQRAP